jgi:heptosyltransferase-2
VVERAPGIDAIIPELSGSLFRIAAELKRGEYDIAFTLASSLSVAAAFRLARIPVRVGFSGGGRGPFLTVAVRPLDRSVHQVEHYLALARAAGVPTPARPLPDWRILPEDRQEAAAFLKASGVRAGSPLIAFAPGASYGPAKRWFTVRWAELGDRISLGDADLVGARGQHGLLRRPRWPNAGFAGARIVIVGGSGEKKAARSIEALMARPSLLAAGELSLGGTAAVLARCRAFVSNDSGLMHVGAAVGAPTLGLFGSTNPAWTCPRGERAGALWERVPCAPCYRRACLPGRGYACLRALSVSRVLSELSALLSGQRRPDEGS